MVSSRPLFKQSGRRVAQRTVWSNGVVVITPGRNGPTRIGEIAEPMVIQTAIAEATVEAFNERVLRRFAGLDEVQL